MVITFCQLCYLLEFVYLVSINMYTSSMKQLNIWSDVI